jgi:hypothetical protein
MAFPREGMTGTGTLRWKVPTEGECRVPFSEGKREYTEENLGLEREKQGNIKAEV